MNLGDLLYALLDTEEGISLSHLLLIRHEGIKSLALVLLISRRLCNILRIMSYNGVRLLVGDSVYNTCYGHILTIVSAYPYDSAAYKGE